MQYSLHNDDLVVRTPFSDQYDLVQVMHGMRMNADVEYNHPVDFRCAGLVDKNDRDIWHIDIMLSWATDEASPAIVYGANIGANHAYPCVVVVTPVEKVLTVRDIGTVFTDAKGLKFTLIRVVGDDLWFLSENIGKDLIHFAFVEHVERDLIRPSDGLRISIAAQHGREDMHRSNRYVQKTVTDYGTHLEIDEIYHIINPATVCDAIIKQRPEGGYTANPDVALGGTPMGTFHHTFTFYEDGHVKMFFDKQMRPGYMMDEVLGNMFQEKCNLGQGVVRYLDGVKPVMVDGVEFDFAKGVNINKQPITSRISFTPDTWVDPKNPPYEQRDVILDAFGNPFVTFTFKYELEGQGAPKVRKNVTRAWTMPTTRKTYPCYAENSDHIVGTCYRSYTKA